MKIENKQNDPIADTKLVDAYFRWALMAIAEMAGEPGLDSILRSVGMDKFRQFYESNQLAPVSGLTFRDCANVNAGALGYLGVGSTGYIYHSGRVSARHAMRMNGKIFSPPSRLVSGQMAPDEQLRASLETVLAGYRCIAENAGQEYHGWLTETDTHFNYHLESCAVCAGKSSTEPICMFFTSSLMESIKWFTAQNYKVAEVECRAMNAPACVWEVEKLPAGEDLTMI